MDGWGLAFENESRTNTPYLKDLRKRQLEVGRVGGTFLGGRFARVKLCEMAILWYFHLLKAERLVKPKKPIHREMWKSY